MTTVEDDRYVPNPGSGERYGSDLMVDVIKSLGLPFLSLNPGSSFRGLHDSLVNYGGNEPQLIECPHEKIAVGLAHGYARATGKPMGVILHNVVGLLHGVLGIYYAHLDRTPVIVFGGAGPMDVTRRRPAIDWIHTANTQGNAVRDYTKWDDQPATIGSVPQSIYRAYRVAMQEPRGPVYIGLDAGLQEDLVEEDVELPNRARLQVPRTMGADPVALQQLAEMLVEAERPVMICGYAGRDPAAFDQLVELAELVGVGAIDTNIRLNFPNRHPLNVTGSRALEEADLVFFVDVKDLGQPSRKADYLTRQTESTIPPDAKVVDLGFNDLGIAAWSHDFGSLEETDLQITADTAVALPVLVELCRQLVTAEDSARTDARSARKERLSQLHEEAEKSFQDHTAKVWGQSPVSVPRLVSEVWEVVKEHDWVLSAGNVSARWATRIFDLDAPYRHTGKGLGTSTQISMALGVALAHRDQGKLVVALQPDGDLMFDPGALWVASYHRIPMLVVMFNNRAYYNDWQHQIELAKDRGTPVENSYLGMEIDNPAPDFAGLARSFGWYGEGPIDDPDAVQAAVRRAADIVLSTGQPALVDVVCQPK